MKVLLLADVPPCKGFPGGLVLDQLCRFLPPQSLACFSVVERGIDFPFSPDLAGIPHDQAYRPQESYRLPGPTKYVSLAASLAMETYSRHVAVRKLVRRIATAGRRWGIDRLWCVLQSQTSIRLAVPLAQRLGVPLLTQIWDPPTWWLRNKRVDPFWRRQVLREFGSALRYSSMCGAASWAMAEDYCRNYSAKAIPLMPCLDASLALPPARSMHAGNDLIIGLAGQLYASQEFDALTSALSQVDWKIQNRLVRIRVLGRQINLHASGGLNIEFLGWRDQRETIRLMSESDILYCPYWFDPAFQTEAMLSFPSKLTTFLAAGRPVIVHGPEYASPSRFMAKYQAGCCCNSLKSDEILACLNRFASDEEYYTRCAANGRKTFDEFLTLPVMRRSFAEFLQVPLDCLLPE